MYCWMKSVPSEVALEQVVADDDGLQAGAPAALELAQQRGEEVRPVLAADGLEHLDRDDGVERRVGDVAVVLQPQIDVVADMRGVNAPLRPGQLFGRQRHAGRPARRIPRRGLGQRTPAAADLEQALARLHAALVERTQHLGALRVGQRPAAVALEPGAGVVHRLVEPQPVERVAQVVVGVDVVPAAAARVAVEQVPGAVQQRAPPAAIDDALDGVAVGDEDRSSAARSGLCQSPAI